MVEWWVICLAAIHTPNGSSTVQLIMSVVYGDDKVIFVEDMTIAHA